MTPTTVLGIALLLFASACTPKPDPPPCFSFSHADTLPAGLWPQDSALADMDNDGDLDLLVTVAGDEELVVYFNDGSGGFGSSTRYEAGYGAGEMAVGDLNADGWTDVVLTEFEAGRVYRGIGGELVQTQSFRMGVFPDNAPSDLALGDVDADGTIDILALASGPDIVYLGRGLGDGSFEFEEDGHEVGPRSRRLAAGDLNGDSSTDVATVSLSRENYSVHPRRSQVPTG